MKSVMVGGHTRNIGKTSVVEGIIRALPDIGWTAVKITQFGHGVCSLNGESCGCSVDEHQFAITQERRSDSGTDTARFLAAGAKRSLWVRTKQGELIAALPALRAQLARDDFVIIESNSLRRFIEPELFLQVVDPSNADFKLSSQTFFDLADAYVVVDQNTDSDRRDSQKQAILLERELKKGKPFLPVRSEDRFVSDLLIEFVRVRLQT
ncbi:MAG: hypothetical protein DMF61_13595 [Blastocatellia bacterium AA13]|nr:MAG: hypothetical protein DMF61_13595 [Blastocatellia bacterium AA13]